MLINVENPIISYAVKGKPFVYDKIFYSTIEPYIIEFKNCKLDKLTEQDTAKCLARIFKKMEVNGIPVLEFFKDDLEKWNDLDQYNKTKKFVELIARDIFCCFDKNRYDKNGKFAECNRLYCIINSKGEKDYIYCNNKIKSGFFSKKHLSPEAKYFADLMEKDIKGQLPKTK